MMCCVLLKFKKKLARLKFILTSVVTYIDLASNNLHTFILDMIPGRDGLFMQDNTSF